MCVLQVSNNHLVSGQPLEADAEHSAACITNIELFQEQEDILVILGGEQLVWVFTSAQVTLMPRQSTCLYKSLQCRSLHGGPMCKLHSCLT